MSSGYCKACEQDEDGVCADCFAAYEARQCECCGGEMGWHSGKLCPMCRNYEFEEMAP